jgi:hypothetical protein
VAVAEDVGADGDRVADAAFGGVPSTVDQGGEVLDLDPLGKWEVGWARHGPHF